MAASFFLTGNFTSSFPAQAKAMAAAGRAGDHSVSHPYFTKLTDAQIRQQVLGAQQTIKAVTGADPAPWFRFPYGDYNAHTVSVVNSAGFVPVGWTVDTLGWEGTSGGITVAKIVSRVLGSLQPGEIVLMHCGSNPTDHSTLDADALPSVISAAAPAGYQFVTLDALRGLGYHVLASGGGVSSFGAPGYGGVAAGTGVPAIGLAADRATGGYWILQVERRREQHQRAVVRVAGREDPGRPGGDGDRGQPRRAATGSSPPAAGCTASARRATARISAGTGVKAVGRGRRPGHRRVLDPAVERRREQHQRALVRVAGREDPGRGRRSPPSRPPRAAATWS